MQAHRQFVQLIAIALIPTMIAAMVLTNQPWAELKLIGRLCHVASIAIAVALLLAAIGRRAVPYLGAVGMLFLVGVTTLQRLPYEISLNVMFLAVGAFVSWVAGDGVAKAILAITLVSGGLMLLQVLGAGEWTQMLATNGLLAGGGKVEVPLEPAFLVSAADFQGSFLQGRPSGLFHSNQFASLMALVAIALTVTMQKKVSIVLELALCVVSTLLLSKVVFLGMAIILVALFVVGRRQTSFVYGAMMLASVFAYANLFPGLFQLFLFNPYVFTVSIVVRVIDMASALGLDANTAMAMLRQLGIIENGQMNDALVAQIVAESAVSGRSTAFAALSHYTPVFLSAAAVCFLCWLAVPSARQAVKSIPSRLVHRNIMIAIALATFCLAADFLASGLFWAMVGFGVPRLAYERGNSFPGMASSNVRAV